MVTISITIEAELEVELERTHHFMVRTNLGNCVHTTQPIRARRLHLEARDALRERQTLNYRNHTSYQAGFFKKSMNRKKREESTSALGTATLLRHCFYYLKKLMQGERCQKLGAGQRFVEDQSLPRLELA